MKTLKKKERDSSQEAEAGEENLLRSLGELMQETIGMPGICSETGLWAVWLLSQRPSHVTN